MWSFKNFQQQVSVVNFAPLADNVLAAAHSILGQKEEPGNSGFKDKTFQLRMQQCGWSKGESWCAYTAELIWKTGFGKDHKRFAELDTLFSGSAVKTFENFAKSLNFLHGDHPKPGALVVWRHGNTWQGHIGVVTEVMNDNQFKSIEGNTNAAGGREGIEVAEKIRKVGQPFTSSGLNIIGFIYLPE